MFLSGCWDLSLFGSGFFLGIWKWGSFFIFFYFFLAKHHTFSGFFFLQLKPRKCRKIGRVSKRLEVFQVRRRQVIEDEHSRRACKLQAAATAGKVIAFRFTHQKHYFSVSGVVAFK